MTKVQTPDVEAGQIVSRLRRELARRTASASTCGSDGSSLVGAVALPRWRPEQGGLPEKSAYSLQELLQYDDEQFVEVAYQVILRRPADEIGLRHHCQELRSGGLSKVEVLGALRWSQEGLQNNVHVDGLLLPYTVQKWCRRRWIGPMLGWAYAMTHLPRLVRLQAISSARGAREACRIGQLLNQVTDGVGNQADAVGSRLRVLSAELRALEERVWSLSNEESGRIDKIEELLAIEFEQGAAPSVHGQTTQVSRIGRLERRLVENTGEMDARIGTLEAALQVREEERVAATMDAMKQLKMQLESRLAEVEARRVADARGVGERHEALMHRLDTIQETTGASHSRADERLEALEQACTHLAQRISNVAASIPDIGAPAAFPPVRERNLGALYAAFEEAFRGSDELVKMRVGPYVQDVASTIGQGQGELIIDIGCGRGEWLELLRDAGYQTRGIDSNEVFVQTCRSKELDVTHGDAFDVLRQVADASAAGITSMHLVEHLEFELLIDLLDECHRILRPGGILVLETPNPENIMVGSNWFYMDPTHRNPLPPGLLFWLTRSRGFIDVRVERLTTARDVPMPDLLPEDAVGAASINMVLEHFRAPVDYAVIARRGA